jgi:hypothetical protein
VIAVDWKSGVMTPLTAPVAGPPANYERAGLLWMKIAGRIPTGGSIEHARAQLDVVWSSIKADIIPPTHAGAP